MAIAKVEYGNNTQGSVTDLVIDISKIQDFIKPGVSPEKIKDAINKRAEEQVDTEPEIQAINNFIRDGKVNFDSVMDAKLLSDKGELRKLLEDYGLAIDDSKKDLVGLASAIDFQLTDTGKIKIPGNTVTTPEQAEKFYKNAGTTAEDCVQNLSISQKSSEITANNVSVPNQVVAYRNTNGYEGSDDLNSRDKDYTKSDARRALKEMMKGKNDDLDFVAEGDKVGDRKVDLATKADKQYLKEYFFRPLKRLCIHTDGGLFERSVSENGLNPSAVWREMVSAFDAGKDVTSSATWKEIFKTTNLPVTRSGNNEKQFGNWMSQLGILYAGYRSEKGQFDKSTYIGKLVGQLDNELLRNEDDYSVATGKEGVTKFYNNSNNKVKDIIFSGDHKILDGKSDENKAERKLSELNISKDQAIKYGQSAVETYNVKILNDFADPKNMTREEQFVNFLGDTSFNGNVDNSDVGTRSGMQIVSQYRSAVEQYALLNNISPKQAQGAVILNIISFLQRQSGINSTLKDGGNLANRLCNVVSGGADCIGKNLVGKGALLSQHPEILKFMQDKLMNHPGALDGILLYGSQGESKMQEEYRNTKIAPAEYIQAVDACGEKVPPHNREAVKTVMKNNSSEIDKMVKSMRTTNAMSEQQLLQNIALNVSNVLTKNAPMVWNGLSGSDREFAMKRANTLTKDTQVKIGDKPFSTTLNGVEVSGAFGVGASLALAKNIKLNYGLATDGATLAPSLGISAQQDLGSGRRAGEQVHLIVPGFSGTITKTFDKGAKVSGDLDTVAAKKVTIGVDGNISVLGVGAGVGFFKEKDFVSGIEAGYKERLSAGEKIISSIIKGIDLGSIKDTAVLHDKIRASINTLYGQKSDPAKVNAMTDSLYAAMLSYNSGDLANINPDVLVSQLSQAFAGEWRNQSAMALKGTKLTGRGMRLGVNTNPWEQALNILTLGTSLKFTNFNRGLHYETTAASLQEMHDAEVFGKNTRRLSDGFGSREVEMMNRLFESVHNTNDKLPDIVYDESKNIVRIPQGLWNKQSFVTPAISPSLKEKVMIDTNGDLVVPSNVPVSLNAFYQQSGAEFILSLGSATIDSDAFKLRTGTTLPSDRQAGSLDGVKFEGINKANNLTKEKVQSVIDGMKAKKGFENFNVQVVSADNYKVKLTINGVVQEFPSNRELTVIMKDKILSVVQGNETAGKLSLKFDNKDNTSTTNSNKNDIPLGALEYHEVDTEKKAMDEINDNLSTIEKIENQNDDSAKEGFYQFMDAVQRRDTNAASGYLVKMFEKQPRLATMVALLNNGTLAEKEVIVSRMLSVFALEDASYKGKTLQSIIDSRDATSKNSVPAYQRLGKTPMNFVSREDIKAWFNAKEVKHGSKVDMPNVLGYTAFYRRSISGNKDHRGYALTTPGYTNSLVPPHDLTGDKRDEAMKWLSKEIDKDPFAKRAIKDALTNKLKDYGVVSDENVVSIMQGASEIKLGNGTIVKLTTTPVFYFLAECANESIGLRIDSMIVNQGGGDVVINTDLTDTSSIDFSAGGGGFYMNTTEGRGVATVASGNSRQVGMGAAAKFGGGNGGGDDGYTRGSSETGGSNQQNHGGGSTNTGGSTNGGGVPGDMPTNP